MGSLGKSAPLMLMFIKAPILLQHFPHLLNIFLKLSVILLCVDDTIFYSKDDWAANLWQQL